MKVVGVVSAPSTYFCICSSVKLFASLCRIKDCTICVYFNAEVIDNNWVQLKVLDGNDFSKVYMNYSFSKSFPSKTFS